MNQRTVIITVNYNQSQYTLDCIQSVLNSSFNDFHLFLLDNGSEYENYLWLKENLPKDHKFLIYANHTSELDISILMYKLPEYPIAFLSKKAVLDYLSIGKTLLYSWITVGKIPCLKINSRRLIDVNDLDKFIEDLKFSQGLKS